MVRNYVRKSERATTYSKDTLLQAVEEVKKGSMTVYGAAKRFNIPQMTLHARLKGKRGVKSQSYGRSTAIPLHLEKRLVNGLKTLEKWGLGLSRTEVLSVVGDFVSSNNLETPFKNGMPGEDWFLNFKKRHNLSIKKPQSLEFARKKTTDPFVISHYFDILKKTLDDLDLHDKPGQIWNLDETNLSSDPSKTKVVGQKGSPSSRVTSGPGRDNTTILAAISADGKKAPPLIIFKGKSVWDQWVAPEGKGFPGTVYAASANGWIDSTIFCNFFEKTLVPSLGSERPVLVVYDGHTTHMSIPLIEVAIKEQITILKLPPHTSHLLQPLDLSVFRSFKLAWDSKFVKWQRQNQGVKIPKKVFSVFVGETWMSTSRDILVSGLKKAGIFPYNSNVVPKDKFDPMALKRFEEPKRQNERNEMPVETITDGNSSANLETIKDGNSSANFVEVSSPACQNTECSGSGTSFENILIKTVAQNNSQQYVQKVHRKRVAGGAEVITTAEVLDRLAEQQTKKTPAVSRKRGPNKKKPVKVQEISSDSDEDDVVPIYKDSDSSDLESLMERDIENSKNLKDTDETNQVKVGSWVLVKYNTKRSTVYYVGQVIGKEDDWVVKYVRRIGDKFMGPEGSDTDNVPNEDIKCVLDEPTFDRRGNTLAFNVGFDGMTVR